MNHHLPTIVPPSAALYGEFQVAFEHFNQALFGGRLRPVLFTLKCKPRSLGHFAADRFGAIEDSTTTVDEIAMNPIPMMTRELRDTLSTLVHEMVHLEQHQYGKPGKGAHHNKEWGAWMERIGLIPSSTGAPGGKKTGNKVSHYIVDGGPFDRACDALLSCGFKLSFGDLGAYDATKSGKQGKRVKYVCEGCGLAAWAKHDAKLGCFDCGVDGDCMPMFPA